MTMHRLVADDPGVVSRLHDAEVTGPVLHLLTIVHDHLRAAGHEVAGVRCLATVGLGDWLVTSPLHLLDASHVEIAEDRWPVA